jgi:Sulfotransferase domain
MKLLVLGLSRTGTSSLRQALIDLDISDVYHFTSVVTENPPDAKLWVQALEWKLEGKGTWTKDDWDALLGHCMAVSDHPCLTFTDELLETYPDARVILTVRDSVDVWHESVMATIWPFVELLILRDVGFWRKLWRKFLDPDPFGRMTELFHLNPEGMYHEFPTQGKRFYEEHNEKIRRVVPRENLLEFNVKQGWGPLCEFLGCGVPEWEFPRVNERNIFVAHRVSFFNGLNWVVAKNVSKYLAGFAVIGVGIWYTLKRRY